MLVRRGSDATLKHHSKFTSRRYGIVRGLHERVKLAEEGINEFGDPLVPGVIIGPVKSNQECADRYGIDAFPC